MRHLVTGGAGFVGSALVRRLVSEGHEVTVLDRFSRGKRERLSKGAKSWMGDICDYVAVDRALYEQDVIWHLAYVQGTQTFYADPKDVIEVALRGITNLLLACERHESKPDFFLVSSSEVYQNPPQFPTDETVPLSVPDVTNPRYSYGGGKIASEIAALAYARAGVLGRTVIVRPHNIYGPDMGYEHVIPEFAVRMLDTLGTDEREFRIQGTGQETRSFCHIDDCVDGLMVLLEKGESENVYHLGNPAEEWAIESVAYLVAEELGRNITIVPGERPKGSPTRRLPDIGKMAALGFDPQITLIEGIQSTVSWYADQAKGAWA